MNLINMTHHYKLTISLLQILLIDALKALINEPFWKTFYCKLKKLLKNHLLFHFPIKNSLKWFINGCPKGTC